MYFYWGGYIVLVFDLAAVARSESLSWNRAWGRGSPGAPGGSGQRAGSAPRAGRSRAARVGVLVGRGWGAVTVVLSGVPTAAGNALGVRQGRGKPGLRGSRFRWLWVGGWSQLCSRGSTLRLGTPISYAPVTQESTSRRSPGEGHGKPLQYSSLENPMDRKAWQDTAHRIAKNWIPLKNRTEHTPSVLEMKGKETYFFKCFLQIY